MFNLIVFLVSTVAAFTAFKTYKVYKMHGNEHIIPFKKSDIGALLILALLFCPFNVKGDIYTVFGSAKSEGNVYSAFSLYQNGKNTNALFGALDQRAEEDAAVLFGIAVFQSAGRNVIVPFGVAGVQTAGRDAIGGLAGVIYQEAGRRAGSIIVAYQSAAYRSDAGFAGYQKAGTASRYFGLLSSLGELPKDEVKK